MLGMRWPRSLHFRQYSFTNIDPTPSPLRTRTSASQFETPQASAWAYSCLRLRSKLARQAADQALEALPGAAARFRGSKYGPVCLRDATT